MKYTITDLYKSAAVNFMPQFLVILSGLVKVILIPIYLSIIEFGYWQIYLLYFSYLGIVSFGYGDGVFLKHGGQCENPVPRRLVINGGSVYFSLLAIFTISLYLFIGATDVESLSYVYLCLFLTVFPLGYNSLVFSVLLSKGYFNTYAFYNSLDKILFLGLCLIFVSSNYFESHGLLFFLVADVLSKYVVSMVILFRERFFIQFRQLFNLDSISTFFSYTSAGLFILTSNFAEILFLTLPRLFADIYFDLSTFSNLAFGFSLASVLVIGSMAVSTIAMPFIRNAEYAAVQKYFSLVLYIFSLILVLFFMFYNVMVYLVDRYFSKFSEVLPLMPLIFLSTYCLIRFQIYNANFFKAFRLEKKLLCINVISVSVAMITYFILGFFEVLTPFALVSLFLFFSISRNFISDIFIVYVTSHSSFYRAGFAVKNVLAMCIELMSIAVIIYGVYFYMIHVVSFLMVLIILVLILNYVKVCDSAKI